MNLRHWGISRRDFVKAAGALPLAASLPSFGTADPHPANTINIGEWGDDGAGLPFYRYLGPVPFPAPPAKIGPEFLPDDPYFLLGNYRLTLFTHVSGMFQILSGERAWGRLNQGPEPWSGGNDASLRAAGAPTPLIGKTAAAAQTAEKHFGVGYARYRYAPISGVRVTRTISVMPSAKLHEGTSAFVLTVSLRNESGSAIPIEYVERVRAAYAQIFSGWDANRNLVPYSGRAIKENQLVRAEFMAREPMPLLFSRKGRMSPVEGAPPSLFVQAVNHSAGVEAVPLSESDTTGAPLIGVRAACTLAPAEEKILHCIVGYAMEDDEIETSVMKLSEAIGAGAGPHFQAAWNHVVPALTHEQDAGLRREMRWNVAVLEQMATWREYYNETVVPQGTVYDYQWGMMLSSRDLAQHALPLCTTNPALARSVLRFIMKRTLPDGEVKLDDLGYGWAPHSGRITSDQQLFFFLLLNEYLRATSDATILTETISYYPLECAASGSGADHVRDAFLFLRDRIRTSTHGLVKLWNSDWNDMFFFWPTSEPYNNIFDTSESHMNTAMAIAILGDLAGVLERFDHSPDSADLLAAVRQYRESLFKAYLADWGSRPFPRRMYFQNKAVGTDQMWLEPQGFTLLIQDLPVERKKALFAELQTRLMRGEAMGPKQIENPGPQPGTPGGRRENGGFWYALVGPAILGVASFDPAAATEMMRQMTFANYAQHFPQYWTGQWSASDSIDASPLPTEGLSNNMIYCAHSHAWPLYCYLRLNEAKGTRSVD